VVNSKKRSQSLEKHKSTTGIRAYTHELREITWPPHFKPTGIEKYDEKTDPKEWLQVYELAIEATGGDTQVMANYLPINLSSTARTWLMGLPSGSIRS
jgi:hypothetical protein